MWANAQRDDRPAKYRWRPVCGSMVWTSNLRRLRLGEEKDRKKTKKKKERRNHVMKIYCPHLLRRTAIKIRNSPAFERHLVFR